MQYTWDDILTISYIFEILECCYIEKELSGGSFGSSSSLEDVLTENNNRHVSKVLKKIGTHAFLKQNNFTSDKTIDEVSQWIEGLDNKEITENEFFEEFFRDKEKES